MYMFSPLISIFRGSPCGSDGKVSACNVGDLGSILGQEDPLEKEMTTHSRTLAWKIPWMKEPGRLQSMGLQRVGHHWATSLVHRFYIHRNMFEQSLRQQNLILPNSIYFFPIDNIFSHQQIVFTSFIFSVGLSVTDYISLTDPYGYC